MPPTFPIQIFNPASIKPALIGRVIKSPESISGIGQTVATDGGGYWRCAMSGIQLLDSDTIRAWRAWEGTLRGGAFQCIVPIADIRHAPRPMAGGALMRPGKLLVTGDDPYFPEALGYANPLIIATAANAPLRATQIAITMTRGSRPVGGQYFSISHATKGRRMYRTGRIIERGNNTVTAEIYPPLREAIPNNMSLDFDWPSFVAIVEPDTDTAAEILFSKQSTVAISFREAF